MKLFPPARPHAPEPSAGLDDLSHRIDRLERAITDLKQHIDLLPAVARKLFLANVELPPPYDLLSQRFGYLSQNDEDGLLLALFKRVGIFDRRFVEIGCGTNGGNSGFLARECGWRGLMVDARPGAIDKVRLRYTGHGVKTACQKVTREGINTLLTEHGLIGELDFLSIDIDGMDYWVWEAVTACTPRVVAVDYNWLFGPERAVTIPYASEFSLSEIGVRGYRGASLAALVHLGRRKGYRMVATERVNAVFLRNDIAPEIAELSLARGYRAPLNIARAKDVFGKIEQAKLPLVTVTGSGAV